MSPPVDVARALLDLGIHEERFAGLCAYVELLDRWRQRINLIGPGDVDDIWRRHVLDCAQLWPLIDDPTKSVLDLGAGAGLPGLILAILGAEDVTLVDSDQRKAVFLREAARAACVRPRVVAERFDRALELEARRYDIVTARAVATLTNLAPVLHKALVSGGYALLHKGGRVEKELTEARKSWTLQTKLIPSITDTGGRVVKMWDLSPYEAGHRSAG